MGFQGVAFLSSPVCFSTTFHKHCGRGKCLMTATSLKTVVEVSKGKLLVHYFCSNKASFVSAEFHADHKRLQH